MKKDKLEEFFKNHLEHYEEEVTPQVWERLSDNIPPPPRKAGWHRARSAAWLLLITLFLFGGLGMGYQYYSMRRLNQQIVEQNAVLDALKHEMEEMQARAALEEQTPAIPKAPPGAAASPPSTTHSIVNQTEKEDHHHVTPSLIQPESSLTGASPDGRSAAAAPSANLSKNQFAPLAHTDIQPEQSQEIRLPTRPLSPLSTIELSPTPIAGKNARLPLPAIAMLRPELGYGNQVSLVPKPLEKSHFDRHRFFYSAWFEPFHTQFPTLYRPPKDIAKAKALVHHIDFRYGLSTGVILNKKFSLELGFGFMEHLFRINDEAILEYTHENAVFFPNGSVEVNYQYPENGLITIRTGITNQILNDGSDIMPGETFAFDYRINYRIKYYTIPIWMRYKFGDQRLYFQVKGGMVFHSRFSAQTSLLDLQLSFNRLRPGFLQVNANRLKDNYWEAGVGTAASYAITERFHLSLEPTLYLSLTPVFSDKTFTISLNTNVSYRF